ncbi:hypothetical protein [Mucilaginibacter polytrichastri]|uniref:Uncharacterized protein n=1 Tax=Mucilaginibacter polytrichastri TaxID=1302689 RepID=A0A1Q5ZW74_9SPHI|nr:hypothetical protein [Mucilaginibacter polytrichastri]OKS85996.1 hypothetical protein RG47T_1443 [Mucilaginibacter polytrichastri]SFS59872.1 hypothetical protein SAMN04487890_102141 [Mucilaginibacter polytrichastri]
MKSLLMTDAYNNAEELKASLEADLEIMASFEKLMELEEQVEQKVAGKKKGTVSQMPYRRTA